MPTIEYDPAVGLREVIVLSSDDEDDSPSRELAERQNRKIRSLLQEVGKLRRVSLCTQSLKLITNLYNRRRPEQRLTLLQPTPVHKSIRSRSTR